MTKSEDHLEKLRSLAGSMVARTQDTVVPGIVIECASLVVTLSETLDRTQRRVMWLTWAVVILTAVLVVMPFIERSLAK